MSHGYNPIQRAKQIDKELKETVLKPMKIED
jgi:hypothetical protein